MGVKGRFLKAVGKFYRRPENEIKTNEGVTKRFTMGKKVRQGCPLSCSFFSGFKRFRGKIDEENKGGMVMRKKIFA